MLKQVRNPKDFLPDGYFSYVSDEEKFSLAYKVADYVRDKGFTPVASSIVGSALRGTDKKTSDKDVLVIVKDTLKKSKSYRYLDDNGEDIDLKVTPLNKFVDTLEKSVPYIEFWNSPFIIVDEKYGPYFLSLRANKAVLHRHGLRFCKHLKNRGALSKEKERLNIASTVMVIETGHTLVSRYDLEEGSKFFQRADKFIEEHDNYLNGDVDYFE